MPELITAPIDRAREALGDVANRRRELEPTGDFDSDPNVSIDAFVLERLIELASYGVTYVCTRFARPKTFELKKDTNA